VISLDAATVLLQWAVGGLFWLWVTTRRREVGLGYGWLLRSVFLVLAIGSFAVGVAFDTVPVREVSTVGVVIATACALTVSIVRKRAGVSGHRAEHDRRSARVATMTGIDRAHAAEEDAPSGGREFPPGLDLVAPIIGVVGLVAAGVAAGGPAPLAIARTLVGAAFLGVVTDAMLLGHWYLVQPGLSRGPLNELVRWLEWIWPVELVVLIWPVGMLSVLSGTVDDGWNGTLGWMWVACALTTIGLAIATRAALKEKQYSAVMAATGLLYLAILTAFGMDLVARAVLAG
jgi:hypothetical protein